MTLNGTSLGSPVHRCRASGVEPLSIVGSLIQPAGSTQALGRGMAVGGRLSELSGWSGARQGGKREVPEITA